MSENMVERIARAMQNYRPTQSFDENPTDQLFWRGMARAVIVEIGKPTEAMIEAGVAALDELSGHDPHFVVERVFRAMLPAMIDAALKD